MAIRSTNKHTMLDELIEICRLQGCAYGAARSFDFVLAEEIKESLFVTNAKPAILYSRFIRYNGLGINAYSYRDPTVTDYGAPELTIRNSMDFYDFPGDHAGATVRLYANQTASGGTETRPFVELFGNDSNQGKGNPGQTLDDPHFIRPNEVIRHVLQSRQQNSTEQHVYVKLNWIEPDRIPGVEYNSDSDSWFYRGVSLL